MKFVFNELCVSNLEAFSQNDYNQWLNTWLDLLAYSYRLFKEKPCVHSDTHTRGLLPYPYVDRWLGTISPDKRMLFRGLIDRHPYLVKSRETEAYEEFLSSDFLYEGKTAKGLGVAYLLDGIAFSFLSDEKWNTPYLKVEVYNIDGSDCENAFDAKIRHAIRNEHLDIHKQYLGSLSACKKKISSLSLLQRYWESEFPHLEKSNTVFDHMEKTTLNKQSFEKIVENLFKLNLFLDNGGKDIGRIGNCSDESDSTKHKYGEKREFLFGTVRRQCFFHLKLWEMNWRIHFDVDYKSGIAYVGYIGKHLPI